MVDQALSNIRVIDLSESVAASYCSKLLADFGAEVIKVERPVTGDPVRGMGPFFGHEEHLEKSGLFLFLNTNKKSVTLDLESPHGVAVIEELARSSHVVVESFAPGVMERLGLSYERLSQINSRLVLTRFSPFGQTGPYRDYRVTDLTLAALGGWMYHTGDPSGEPLKPSRVKPMCCVHGLFGAVGTLASLYRAIRTGLGQVVDVGAMECLIAATRYFETTYAYSGDVVGRLGDGLRVVTRLVRCKDGWGQVNSATEATWQMLALALERPEWMDDPRLQSPDNREKYRSELQPVMDAWFASRTREECFRTLQEFRVPFAMVVHSGEVLALDQHKARNFFVSAEHPAVGRLTYPGPPFQMSRTPWQLITPAPLLGQHNQEVLGSLVPDTAEPQVMPVRSPALVKQEEALASRDRVDEARIDESVALPLQGIRLLDLTSWWAGPMAAMLLADLGAEVIKVESIQRPDPWRWHLSSGEAGKIYETSPTFNSVQRNKYDLTLNLTSAQGVELFKELTKLSDVVIENYTPRVMPQFGLDYGVLEKVNPGIIMVSASGFGSYGPWRDYLSFAPVSEALSGLTNLIGYSGGSPLQMGVFLADPLVSLYAAVGVLIALLYRERVGYGQHIDVSQLETSTIAVADAIMEYTMNRGIWQRQGNREPGIVPHGCYPAKGENEWLTIAATSEQEWHSLCRVMFNPEESKAKRILTLAERERNENTLNAKIAEWTKQYDKYELMYLLQSNGIAAGAVLGPKELLTDPQLKERGFFEMVDREEVGMKPYPGLPIKFSATPCRIRRPSPKLGEHNEYVLGGILGLSNERMAELENEQIIGREPLETGQSWGTK